MRSEGGTLDYEQIVCERRGRVGLITLNRPERLNAWTFRMDSELRDAIAACNEDAGCGAIVLTGAGRGFCSGMDISGFRGMIQDRDDGRAAPPRAAVPLDEVLREAKPIVCAINGPAVGVGVTLTLAADIRIASEAAVMQMAFIKMGILPGLSSTMHFPQQVGLSNAFHWMLTADPIDAREALRIGLVSAVVPAGELLDHAIGIAARVAAHPPEQVRWLKRLLYANAVQSDPRVVRELEGRYIEAAQRSPAHREAVNAFLEKRAPDFSMLQGV